MRQSISGQRLAAVGVAVLCAGLASAVYRSFVFAEFSPIRIAVVEAEQTASRRVVTIALPDLSSLRGHTAVLSFLLRNRDAEPRRIGLLGDGIPASRAVVPPNGTFRWDIVLSPEIVLALQVRDGDSARTLELTGDADAWDVMAFEISNFHVRWGSRPMAVVLPVRADRYTAAMGFLPVAIAMCVLGLLMARIDSTPKRRPIGLTIDALAFTACLTCVTCLILPRISPYKLLLSPSAFWMLAAALFAKVFFYPFYARQAFVATMRSTVSLVAHGWKRHEVTVERGAALLGLAAIAIAQPIFEVVSNSPEFFPARSTSAGTIVATVLAISFGVPLLLLGIERAIRAVSQTAAMTFHAMVIALLSAALVMPWVDECDRASAAGPRRRFGGFESVDADRAHRSRRFRSANRQGSGDAGLGRRRRELRRTKHPLWCARARHGRHYERPRGAWRLSSLRVHVLDLLRLHASADQAGGAHEAARHPRVYSRQHRVG